VSAVATIPVIDFVRSTFLLTNRESHKVGNVALMGTGALVPAEMMTVSEARTVLSSKNY
jgi:hypothetical protein